jgi:arsenate reductase-like glutaredoxin family protein
MERTNTVDNLQNNAIKASPIAIDAKKIDNAVLKRLIGEIDFDRENHVNAYNRTHNRHNRGR